MFKPALMTLIELNTQRKMETKKLHNAVTRTEKQKKKKERQKESKRNRVKGTGRKRDKKTKEEEEEDSRVYWERETLATKASSRRAGLCCFPTEGIPVSGGSGEERVLPTLGSAWGSR